MGYQRATYNGAQGMRTFLENACDDNNRPAAAAAAAAAAAVPLVSIAPAAAFHVGEELSPAAGMAVDRKGRIFVSDEFNHRVCVYASDGSLLAAIGAHGAGHGEFRYPRGIAAGPDGSMYVADAWNHRIAVIGPDLAVVRYFGALGEALGQLDEPCGVAFSNGRLAVLEKSNHRLQLFTPEGEPLAVYGKRGGVDEQAQFYASEIIPDIFAPPVFEYPTALAADASGAFYIADTNNHRVVKLGPDGAYLSAFTTPGLRYPVGVAADAAGNIHITQFNHEGVQVLSPAGVSLYRYAPKGGEFPSAICTVDKHIYLGEAMKPEVRSFVFDPRHDRGCALEAPFAFQVKEACAAMAAGDWEAAFGVLGDAALAEVPPLPEFAALLPESEAFSIPPLLPPDPGAAAFCRILDAQLAAAWKAVDALLGQKAAACDENSSAVLQLEKALMVGSEQTETFMVGRWRSIKKLLNTSAEIKRTLAALRKITEFRRRLALAGQQIAARLESLAKGEAAVAAWRQERLGWFGAAMKDAPALTFNSGPDERGVFAVNENRLSQLGFEFRALFAIVADGYCEAAQLVRAGLLAPEAAVGRIGSMLDLLLDAPEEAAARLNFLVALEALLEAAAPAAGEWLSGHASPAAWEALGREDNIDPQARRPVYALLAALFAPTTAPAAGADAAAWEKIVAFYHGEFAKFVGENTPMRAEHQRSGFLLPMAEKSDPKQAAVILRKMSLLNYHTLFQERYIASMMQEYLVRYALFAAHAPGMAGATAEKTAAAVDALAAEAAIARAKEMTTESESLDKMRTAAVNEKQDLKMRAIAASAASGYLALLGEHLSLARAALNTPEAKAPRLNGTLLEAASGFRRLRSPTAACFDAEGNLYVVARFTVSVFDPSLRPLRTIGTFGQGHGMFGLPMDIALTPDGSVLVSQMSAPELMRFAPSGSFDRVVPLAIAGGRRVYRMQADNAGNIYASFFDGEGIVVFDASGKALRAMPAKGSPLERLGAILGFALVDGVLYAGGNGMLAAVDAASGALKHFADTGFGFGQVNGIAADDRGNIFFLDYTRNLVGVADPAFAEVRLLPGLRTVAASGVAARNGRLAVCDYAAHRVRLFTLP